MSTQGRGHRPTPSGVAALGGVWLAAFGGPAAADDCVAPAPPTFTVFLPKLGQPPDEEGQGWNRPAVWAGHPGAGDDAIEVPNGRPIYALFVSGYARNAYLDEMTFYNFARYLMAQGGLQEGTLAADFNRDMAVNSADISAFLTARLQAVIDGC